jgi:hypothetical protein
MTAPSETEALVWALSTRLIAGATATDTLLSWCEEHGLAHGPITVEVGQRFAPAVVPNEVMAALGPAASESVHYRQVQLRRGSLPQAAAENWFVPHRLAAGMDDLLQTTDVPFETVIAPLRPSRCTIAAQVRPLPTARSKDQSRLNASAHRPQPTIILEQEAVILSGTGTVLALVKERFFSDLVAVADAELSSSRGLDERDRRQDQRRNIEA